MRLKAGVGVKTENTEKFSDSGENILGHIHLDKCAVRERRGEQMKLLFAYWEEPIALEIRPVSASVNAKNIISYIFELQGYF